MRIHAFGYGPNRDGLPAVSFNITLDSGDEVQIGWVEDDGDTAERSKLIAYYEPKILAKLSGEVPFQGNGQAMGFEVE